MRSLRRPESRGSWSGRKGVSARVSRTYEPVSIKKIPVQKSQWQHVQRTRTTLSLVLKENTPWEDATWQMTFRPARQPIDKHFWLKDNNSGARANILITQRAHWGGLGVKKYPARQAQGCSIGISSWKRAGWERSLKLRQWLRPCLTCKRWESSWTHPEDHGRFWKEEPRWHIWG